MKSKYLILTITVMERANPNLSGDIKPSNCQITCSQVCPYIFISPTRSKDLFPPFVHPLPCPSSRHYTGSLAAKVKIRIFDLILSHNFWGCQVHETSSTMHQKKPETLGYHHVKGISRSVYLGQS